MTDSQLASPGTAGVIRVGGEVLTELPQDLYIPPEALRIFLEAFEGPMDLLLYLIKKQNLDILDLPIAEITAQYIKYIDVMRKLEIALAAEYLVMAATLAEIKSRWLLPRADSAEEEYEGDPRAELIRRLQEYERYKSAAEAIDLLPRLERELSLTAVALPKLPNTVPEPDVSLDQLAKVFADVMRRAKLEKSHRIEYEALSIRERMASVLDSVSADDFTEFSSLFNVSEGTMGVTVTFIAILELAKQSALEFMQRELFAEIYVRATIDSGEDNE